MRISGKELVGSKKIYIALRNAIFGIGYASAKLICQKLGISENLKTSELTSENGIAIQKELDDNFIVESQLRSDLAKIKRLYREIKCRRGLRAMKSLPIRGQKTRRNCRTARKMH